MAVKQSGGVREFPTRMVSVAGCAVVLALAILGWTAYDGFRQAQSTEQVVRMGQAMQSRLVSMQQSLSSLLIMETATGDIRWSYRYTAVINDLKATAGTAASVSRDFQKAVDRMVHHALSVSQYQTDVFKLIKANRLDEAREAVLGEAFKSEREGFQASLESLDRAIQQLSIDARITYEKRLAWSGLGAILVTLFAGAVGVVCGRRVKEWRRALSQTIDELHEHETELESRVADRTRALDEAEQMMRAAVDNMPGGILMLDNDLNIVFHNDRYCDLYGLPEDILQPGRPVRDVLEYNVERGIHGAGDPVAKVEKRMQEFLSSTPGDSERCVDGARWLNVRHEPRPDGGVVLIATDITARKVAEQKFAAQEALMRMSMENLPGAFWVVDEDMRIVLVNDKYKEFYGDPDDQVRVGVSMRNILKAEIERGTLSGEGTPEEILRERVEGYKTMRRYEDQTPDGRHIQLTRTPAPGGYTVCVTVDISKQKQAEAEAAQKNLILQAVLNSMIQGVVAFDDDLRLIAWNEQFLKIRDYPSALGEVGRPFSDFMKVDIERNEFGEGDPEQQLAFQIERARQFSHHEFERRRPNGQFIEVRGGPLPSGGFVSTYTDITEGKKASQVIEDAHAVMSDSIQYASRIQRSLLPDDSLLDETFADHFCLWEPRDVVGGDMYWMERDRSGYFVALFDCTGHGVPGALMTTIAVSALKVAFAETGDPSRLITRVNQIVKQALSQEDKKGLSDDGLEMGVCLVEPERMRVTYAGARFELVSAHNGSVEIIKGDKSGLGYRHVPFDRRFTNHSIRLHRGQRFYMYTDGVTDQVGGNKRRAFGRKRLMGLLDDVGHLPMARQGEAVTRVLADYQGGELRRDDISMIGFMPLR